MSPKGHLRNINCYSFDLSGLSILPNSSRFYLFYLIRQESSAFGSIINSSRIKGPVKFPNISNLGK